MIRAAAAFGSNGSPVMIDTRGVNILQPEIVCDFEGREYRFVLAADGKQGRAFHLGLFINGEAYCKDVFRYPRQQRVCALFESPISSCYRDIDELVRRFPIIFTHQQHLIDRGKPFVPLLFGTNWISVRDEADTARIRKEHPEKTKLVSFIGSLDHPDEGAYQFRRRIAEHCLTLGDVDCFGKGTCEVPGKREAIAPYMFSIAMENAASDDYFSEKLIDCVLLETVPIYYGAPGIGSVLDIRGLLTFNNLSELRAILNRLTPELYKKLRPFAVANKQRVMHEQWHNHQALFQRIARRVPLTAGDFARVRFYKQSRIDGIGTKIRGCLRRLRERGCNPTVLQEPTGLDR